jgi:hypothetical protein
MQEESTLEGYELIRQLTDSWVGTLEVWEKSGTAERVLVKRVQETIQNISFVKERIQTLAIKEISPLLSAHMVNNGCQFVFSVTCDSLYSARSMPPPSSSQLGKLLQSLSQMGLHLHLNLEHHPSITLQNIYLKNDQYFIVNPYVYDSHIVEALSKRELFAALAEHCSQGSSDPAEKSAALKSLMGVPEYARRCRVNGDRLQTNMFQIGVVALALGLKLKEVEIKEGLKTGKLNGFIQTLTERKIDQKILGVIKSAILGNYSSFQEMTDHVRRALKEPADSKEEESSFLGRPTDFESEK